MTKQSPVISLAKFAVFIVLLSIYTVTTLPLLAQGMLRDRFQRHMETKDSEPAQDSADVIPDTSDAQGVERCVIAGLKVAVWEPAHSTGPAPLVVFSHGFHGGCTQSKFIMEALSKAGYLVVAPDHKDAGLGKSGGLFLRPEVPFTRVSAWSDKTYKTRADDIVNLMNALHKDPKWSARIDWNRLALSGHSLGGYTAMGLGGAWPSWKLPGVKAILAISPYCMPFTVQGTLRTLGVPIMYQGGTKDRGITPTLIGANGAVANTSSPVYFVEFNDVGHFSFTNMNRNRAQEDLISHYCVAFLDKYVKGDAAANPGEKLPGVVEMVVK